jgi:hypothetical protein
VNNKTDRNVGFFCCSQVTEQTWWRMGLWILFGNIPDRPNKFQPQNLVPQHPAMLLAVPKILSQSFNKKYLEV